MKIIDSAVVYRNPKPYLRSCVAYHPSVVLVGDREVWTTFDLGQAVESLDYHTVAARSMDEGATWELEGSLIDSPPPRTTHTVRTRMLKDGNIVGFGGFFRREDSEEGLVNRETSGFVPVDLFWISSRDGGRSWSPRREVHPPLPATSWELCHPIIETASGRWLAPTATWRGWEGVNPCGEQTVALISDDRGETWPRFGRIFDGRESGRSHLEVSMIELQDGRLLAVSWAFSFDTGETYPTQYVLSADDGDTFTVPRSTGFLAQTCKLLPLSDGRILCAYRRHDHPGLWGSVARLEEDRWINMGETALWEGAVSGMAGKAPSGEELGELKFGYPSMCQLPGGLVLLLFWCQEDCVTQITQLRIEV